MRRHRRERTGCVWSAFADGLVPLSALQPGEHAEVAQVACGRGLLGRMAALGFTPGAQVTVVQNFGHGPLIALVREARIALGRGEASRIYVRRGAA